MTTTARTRARRLPPGGAELLALRKQGFIPSRWLIITRYARGPRDTWHIGLPRSESVDDFDLSILRGLNLIVNLLPGDPENARIRTAIEAAKPNTAAFIINDQCDYMYWGEKS